MSTVEVQITVFPSPFLIQYRLALSFWGVLRAAVIPPLGTQHRVFQPADAPVPANLWGIGPKLVTAEAAPHRASPKT